MKKKNCCPIGTTIIISLAWHIGAFGKATAVPRPLQGQALSLQAPCKNRISAVIACKAPNNMPMEVNMNIIRSPNGNKQQ